MAWSEAGQNQRADATAGLIGEVSLHTGDPGVDGTVNEVAGNGYARQAPAFDPAAGGAASLSAAMDFNGPAEETVAYAGLWDDVGTFLGSVARTGGDTAFNANGEYSISSMTVTSTGAIT